MYKSKYLILVLLVSNMNAQINITELCPLMKGLTESSGVISQNLGKTFWTINDSDAKPDLYEIDQQCNLLRTVIVKNATNKDWEEITTDKLGNLYIGDFGNNDNSRKDQRIYKISKSELEKSDSVEAEIINFKYASQLEFPPADPLKNFDMEAMIWLDHKLHLFSKNRTNPFSGYTYHYTLPDTVGNYNLQYVDSFKTGPGPSLLFWVTAAAISPDENQLLLLTHDKIWLFYPLNKLSFFNSPVKTISLGHFSQKEAITYGDSNTIFITDEINNTINNGGKLYKTSLQTIVNTTKVPFFNRPSTFLYVKEFIDLDLNSNDLIEIISIEGKSLLKQKIMNDKRIHVDHLTRGLYFLIVHSDKILKRIAFFKD